MITQRCLTRGRIDLIRRFGLRLAFCLSVIAPAAVPGQTGEYSVSELPAAADSVRVGLNNLGDVAGKAGHSEGTALRVTVWKHGGLDRNEFLSLFRDEYSSASGINDLGDIVGDSNSDTSIVPCRWKANGDMEHIPMLAGHTGGQALATNNRGDVVGYSSGPLGARGFFWARKSGLRDLGVLPGGTYSRARDVNDRGEIVGVSSTPAGEHAVLWNRAGGTINLGTLPGDSTSEAIAINNAGEVIGYSNGPRGMRAFRWRKAAGMQELRMLAGGNSSRPCDINDSGDVVGTSGSAAGIRAVIWTRRGEIRDLNTMIPIDLEIALLEAQAINKKGQVVATGIGGRHRAGMDESSMDDLCAPAPGATFLLTPVAAQ